MGFRVLAQVAPDPVIQKEMASALNEVLLAKVLDLVRIPTEQLYCYLYISKQAVVTELASVSCEKHQLPCET